MIIKRKLTGQCHNCFASNVEVVIHKTTGTPWCKHCSGDSS